MIAHPNRWTPSQRWTFLAGTLLPLLILIVAVAGPFQAVYINERLDSIIDELGAFILVTLAALLLLAEKYRVLEDRAILAWGLLLVGIIRGLDSMTEIAHLTLWLKRLEILGIGVLFAVGWSRTSLIPWKPLRRVVFILANSVVIVLAAVAFFLPGVLPKLLTPDGRSDSLGDQLSLFAGLLSLLAGIVGLWRIFRSRAYDDLVFVNLCFAYGLLGLALPSTQLWHIRWWVLQVIQVFPYLFAFIYVFSFFRRLLDEVAEKTRRLEASNKELENFAYIASHDLQEPLRMINSYLQLLAHRYQGKLGKDADDFIAFAVDGAVRMRRLINDLLAFSRFSRQTVKWEEVDCAQVVAQALRNLGLMVQESQAVVVSDDLPTVRGGRSLLEQLFQNLFNNAIKFRGTAVPRIRIGCVRREKEGTWLFSVRDNGIGFPPSESQRIFLLFHRLHGRAEYPGTGIGLATCKRIVERHDGAIWVESQPGEGTTFYFTLPVLQEKPFAVKRPLLARLIHQPAS